MAEGDEVALEGGDEGPLANIAEPKGAAEEKVAEPDGPVTVRSRDPLRSDGGRTASILFEQMTRTSSTSLSPSSTRVPGPASKPPPEIVTGMGTPSSPLKGSIAVIR